MIFVDVLDGAMILLAIWTMNFLHPGYLLHHIGGGHQESLRGNDVEQTPRETSLDEELKNATGPSTNST